MSKSLAKVSRVDPLVFVLILNYHSFDDTIECLVAVTASEYPNVNVLVIDNASPYGDTENLKKSIAEHQLLLLDKNTGYAGGNNIGIQHAIEAGAEYVFILNPDVRLAHNTITECIKAFEADPRIGAVNPIQIGGEDAVIDKKFFNSILKPACFDKIEYREGEFPDVFSVNELLGAALFMPVSVIKRVGGFDPLYFAYGEETDLCRRLRFHGFKLAVIGNAPIRHLRTKESSGVKDRILFLRLKGIYLGILKDPRRSFRRSLTLVTKQFWREMLGKRKNEYPFNQYPVTRFHSVRAFLWILFHLPSIRRHRRMEQAGRAHV